MEPAPATAPPPVPKAAQHGAHPWVEIVESVPSGVVDSTGPTVSEVTVLPDETPAEIPHVTPVAAAASPARSTQPRPVYHDAVTLLEISPQDLGGISEAPLPGNRAGSPPAPPAARRVGWNHPVARWAVYVLVVVALTLIFLWLLVDLFHLG